MSQLVTAIERISVFVLYDFLPPMNGGIENHVHNVIRSIQSKANVSLLTREQNYNPSYYNKTKIFTFHPSKFFFINFLKYIIIGIKAAKKSGRPEVIHAHTLGDPAIAAIFLSFFFRCPVIVTVHESGLIISVRKNRSRTILRYKFLLKKITKVIAASGELRRYVLALSGESDVLEIPNGVDTDLFMPLEYPNDLVHKLKLMGKKIILCPRRIVPKNGVIYLINAIPNVLIKYPDTYFLFVGPISDKSYWEKIKIKINELNIQKNLMFTGGIPFADMPKYNALSDIIVIPSLIEAISLSALEAMASKKPIIVTSVGGLNEIIKNEVNGLMVPPADSEKLSEAIIKLMNDAYLSESISVNALRDSRVYSWERIAQEIMAQYFEVIKK